MDKEVLPLSQWRKLRLMTQGELAERSGVSMQTINRLEAGRQTPTTRTIKGLMAALEVDPLQIAEVRKAMGVDAPVEEKE